MLPKISSASLSVSSLERFVGDAVGGKANGALANSERQVRHHAEHLVLFTEHFDEALAGDTCHDADERLFALESGCCRLPFGGDELENLRLDAEECDVSLFDAFGKALDADATEGAHGFGCLVARVKEENVLGVCACVQKTAEDGSAHVTSTGKENRCVHIGSFLKLNGLLRRFASRNDVTRVNVKIFSFVKW